MPSKPKPTTAPRKPKPPLPNDAHLIVRLPSDVLNRFRVHCAKNGMTMSGLIRGIIERT